MSQSPPLLRSLALGALLTGGLCGGPAAAATNLLANHSFETDSFAGWTLSGNTVGTTVQYSYNAEDGHYVVYAGAAGSDNDLSQTFSDIAGDTYRAGGWMLSDGMTPNAFGMSIDGGDQIYLTDVPVGDATYNFYSFDFVATGRDTFTVSSRDDPGNLVLDNFSVELAGGTPEPAVWAMLLVGLFGIGAALRARPAARTA